MIQAIVTGDKDGILFYRSDNTGLYTLEYDIYNQVSYRWTGNNGNKVKLVLKRTTENSEYLVIKFLDGK